MIRTLSRKLFRQFDEWHYLEQTLFVTNMFGIIYVIPLALFGLIWLFIESDWSTIGDQWALVLVLFVLGFVVEHFEYNVLMTIGNVRGTGQFTGSLASIVSWSGVFILGPVALWLPIITMIITSVRQRHQWRRTIFNQVIYVRNNFKFLAENSLIALIALAVYEQLDGTYPLPDFSGKIMAAAFAAISIRFVLELALELPYILYAAQVVSREMDTNKRDVFDLLMFASLVSLIKEPFAILAAGVYAEAGNGAYVFLMTGIVLVGVLAQRLSRAAERSRLRTLELEQLEQLGRAIIEGPPDVSTLPDLLQEYVPGMFTQSSVIVTILPDKTLLNFPESASPDTDFERWVRTLSTEGFVLAQQDLPWKKGVKAETGRVYAPILATQSGQTIGWILVNSAHPDQKGIMHWLPAVQSLAAQVASALHSAEVYKQTLEHEKAAQELAVAGRIQNSFLPDSVPDLQGWQLAADLAPARDASGDFYDFIRLSENKLGILVADVADKGVGAALFMALSRTLIRTYAMQYPDQPEMALRAANERILNDTQSDLFVTVFYGVLDLEKGFLNYCNAGHNPGYMCHLENGHTVDTLGKTGIPLGMFENFTWRSDTVTFDQGAVLLLYSDGLTEAHNADEELFGNDRLLALVETHKDLPVQQIHYRIIESVQAFVGDTPQFDDITLMMVQRSSPTP